MNRPIFLPTSDPGGHKSVPSREIFLRISRLLVLGFLLIRSLFPEFTFSQTVLSGAGSVTPLSALGASARADALGDAFTGLADDPSALFFNSAGLSQLRASSLSINHNSYLAGSFEETLLFGLPAGPLGGFAGALQYVAWGGLDQRDPYGVSQGTFSDGDVALGLGWGAALLKDFSLGLAIHGIQQKIVDSLYGQLTVDLGLLFAPFPDLQMGLSYSGLGTDLTGYASAQALHLGLSALLKLGEGTDLKPLLVGEWEPYGVSRIRGGLEGTIEKNYCLRASYQAAFSDNQIGGFMGFACGAGVKMGAFQLDYAFVPYGDLGSSHRVSLGYEFPNPAPVVAKPVTVIGSPVTVLAPPVTVVATPQPIPATGTPRSKVEVLFALPAVSVTPMGESQSASLIGPYEKAAQENPRDSRVWRRLGIVYMRMGQDAQGIQCLEQALRLDPSDLELKKWLDDYHAKHPGSP